MKVYFITFRSITHAQQGERLLNRAGMSCTLVRTPRQLEELGCGYSLRLKTGEITRALELLRREQLPVRRLYSRGSGGEWEAVL